MKKKQFDMTDEEIIYFINSFRADGNIKYDLLRHRIKLIETYINPFSYYAKHRPVLRGWIYRLKGILKSKDKLWHNKNA